MYQNFFGLQEQPFSIAPDPHYLYMSERHQEALAHLTQGLQGSGGFILLTGEVGTGKTTVSRALLEQLPESTNTAFILNPMLNEDELLASLCDEFGIRYQKRSATRKSLTDKLSQFLLQAHEDGQQCVVLIDEAQHLKPQVLEQLRLLTNLETHQHKLLRVILIGQPELQELLRRRELRQLAQRITARYHILPLTEQDTERYIAYRLQVAGASRALFTHAACATAHKLTHGVPRLLNLICDRAMLFAYTEGAQQVQPQHIKAAAKELEGPAVGSNASLTSKSGVVWGLAVVATLLLLIAAGLLWGPKLVTNTTDNSPNTVSVDVNYQAAEQLARIWQLPQPPKQQPFCQWVEQYQLACLQAPMSMLQIRSINYPAVLFIQSDERQPESTLVVDNTEAIDTQGWSGRSLLLYQQPFLAADMSSEEHQQWLQRQLNTQLSDRVAEQGIQQPSSSQLLRELQRQVGLPVTGELNAITLAWLSSQSYSNGPRLSSR